MVTTIVASAPGRCGIIGNPSDIYGGRVLSCSIPARATCRLTLDGQNRMPEDLTLWKAATARFPLDGASVEWHSDVPRSSGLAGSTALLAATLACVLQARGEAPDLESVEGRTAFAELVRDVERVEAKVMCGFQDAYMAVFGGLQQMDFEGKRPDQLGGPPAKLTSRRAELPFLLVTTGVERLSGSVHGPMAERWLKGEQAVLDGMQWISQAVQPAWFALWQGSLAVLGQAMDENQRIIAALGGSGEPIDRLIRQCKDHGAVAAKLAGAGMGGTVIALTPEPDALEARLRTEGYTRFVRPAILPGVRFEPI